MKIKVGDQIFDGDNELVAIYLTAEEKQLITDMAEDSRVLCQSPGDVTSEARMAFVKQFRADVEDKDDR